MAYNREAHELIEATLQKMIATEPETAYARMVGYLMPNVNLTDAKMIARLVEEKEAN